MWTSYATRRAPSIASDFESADLEIAPVNFRFFTIWPFCKETLGQSQAFAIPQRRFQMSLSTRHTPYEPAPCPCTDCGRAFRSRCQPHGKRESPRHPVSVTLDLIEAYFRTDSALMNSGFADHSSVEFWECDAKMFELELPSTAVNSRSSPD